MESLLKDFFTKFAVTNEVLAKDLRELLKVALKINAPLEWLRSAPDPYSVIFAPGECLSFGEGFKTVKKFCLNRDLLTKDRINFLKEIVSTTLGRFHVPIFNDFLDILGFTELNDTDDLAILFNKYETMVRTVGKEHLA